MTTESKSKKLPVENKPTETKTTSKNGPLPDKSQKKTEKISKENDDDYSIQCWIDRYLDPVFRMEITPAKFVIDPDGICNVSMKCVAKYKQEVVVEVDSFMFKLLNPRGQRGTISQTYCIMLPGETLNFQIALMKEIVHHIHEDKVGRMKSPEGTLSIKHKNTRREDDADKSWVGTGHMNNPYDDEEVPTFNGRIVEFEYDYSTEQGIFQEELTLEREIEVTRKRRVLYMLAKRKVTFEEKRKEELKKQKEKEKKKKCCGKCTIL